MIFIKYISMLLLVLISFQFSTYSIELYDLPVISDKVKEIVQTKINKRNKSTNKYIPQIAWIAVRNISEDRPSHMNGPSGFVERNQNWKINFCDNTDKDLFMETFYANSSILWSYNILNPIIGTAKVEIWRLAVLYLYGGMYMDDDAHIPTKLDKVVQPNDKFIVGKEPYDFDDRCYTDDYPISNHSMNSRFGLIANNQIYFDNKFFFNWALFSMPGNPLLLRIMEHIVLLLKYEYMNDSKIKMSPTDHRGKLLMCVSTFPITHAAKEMLLEGKGLEIGLRVGGEYFREYGAMMKAWNNDWRPDRWVKQIHKYRLPYLRAYAPTNILLFEEKLIQLKGQREIYLVKDKRRHTFPDFTTFIQMGYKLDDVHILSHDVVSAIPMGKMLPKKKNLSAAD